MFNSKDYSKEFDKFNRQSSAKSILKEAGSEAIDAILDKLAVDGVGSEDLAELLTKIADPKAVPLLKKMLDRGKIPSGWTKTDVETFVKKYS